MATRLAATMGRRTARAILVDADDRLLLIKRTKPGQAVYWTTPGGGVDDTDASIEAAMHREIAEEMGAEAAGASQVFLNSRPSAAGVAVQHFFVARLTRLDWSARSDPEFADPAKGSYELASIDLVPVALKKFILANRAALLAQVAAVGTRPPRPPRGSRSMIPEGFGARNPHNPP